jgi:NAD(P)-dependent dehydrogenase (short-subunit alcohol dehydrogenase family)
LVARRKDKLEALAKSLQNQGFQAQAFAADLTDLSALSGLVSNIEASFGGLQVLVNNAGILIKGLAGEAPMQAFRDNMEANYFAPIALTQHCLPLLRRNPRSMVVFTTSGLALKGFPGLSPYCSTKAALESYADSLTAEEQRRGVQVLLARPDLTATPMMTQHKPFQTAAQAANKIALGMAQGDKVVNCTWRVKLLAHTHEPLRGAYDKLLIKLM